MVHALSVPVEEIERQRLLGWPDFHPEAYCHRCGQRNVRSWATDSDLWAAAKDARDDWPTADIVCPQCFTEAVEAARGGYYTWFMLPDYFARSGRGRAHDALQGAADYVRGIDTQGDVGVRSWFGVVAAELDRRAAVALIDDEPGGPTDDAGPAPDEDGKAWRRCNPALLTEMPGVCPTAPRRPRRRGHDVWHDHLVPAVPVSLEWPMREELIDRVAIGVAASRQIAHGLDDSPRNVAMFVVDSLGLPLSAEFVERVTARVRRAVHDPGQVVVRGGLVFGADGQVADDPAWPDDLPYEPLAAWQTRAVVEALLTFKEERGG